jgi:hypothetical protein
MNKPIQHFTPEYLEYCKQLSAEQIVEFLENFRYVAYAGRTQQSKLISIKIPIELLNCFKFKAKAKKRPYQSVIKELMFNWILHGDF